VAVVALLALSAPSVVLAQHKAQSEDAAEKAFQGGNGLMQQGKYCEALARYQEGLAISPDASPILYNAGLAAHRCKDYAAAVKLWGRLKALDPEDWQVRAKLVQGYQALGQLRERDAERAALFELRKRGANEELSKRIEYCREQFEAGGEKVMAFEHFELKGERALRYVFSILNDAGDAEKHRISLGSYDSTNQFWHETAKPRPKDDERLFHLDGYYDWGHATYGMYFPEPSYEEIRKVVIEILEKKKNPTSVTRVPSAAKTPGERK
jgi:tetratricopeptide (TPR) repeat protein